jgi:uncharacterized membrane protein
LFAIALVVVSPWLTPRSRPNDARSVVWVVDRSASIGPKGLVRANLVIGHAWDERKEVKLGLVAFDGAAEVLAPVGSVHAPDVGPGSEPDSSDLAAAIRLAAASLPREGHRTIVLLTDARPTRGDAVAEVRRAADIGIRIDVVPLEIDTDGDAPRSVIAKVAPRTTHVAENQPVSFDVTVQTKDPVQVVWSRDGYPLHGEVAYQQGRRRYGFGGGGVGGDDDDATATPPDVHVELRDPKPPPGVHVYEVKLGRNGPRAMMKRLRARAAGDAPKEEPAPEPSTLVAVTVDGRAHAAVFSSAGEVAPALRAELDQLGLEARVFALEKAGDSALYAGADLVVLEDVRLSSGSSDEAGLTRAAQTGLLDYVQQGGGLLVTGGAFGFAPEYSGTPLARALPVEIEDRGHVEDPPVSLAIMLDRSGSMAATVGDHTKIELAIEASLAAADVLRSTDTLALGSVDTETHWDIPLGPVERVAALKANVRQVEAGGGGIYVYTALKDAYKAIEKGPNNPIRHVILFSDTSDSEEQVGECKSGGMDFAFAGCSVEAGGRTAESLAKEARSHGITTTVVGIGEEEAQHTPFLRRLAAAAGGRFYITSEGTDLRRIFLSETRVLAQSNLREQKANVVAAGAHPALEGVDAAKLPPVTAYVETARRASADTALLIDDPSVPGGRPMLATWRYGLGKVGAITTDLADGWADATKASPAGQVLKQTLRFLLRQSDAHRADVELTMHDHVVDVSVELPPDAPDTAAPRALEAWAVDRDGKSRGLSIALERRGPGRWVGHARTGAEPIVVARARDGRGALMGEAVGQEDRISEISGFGFDEPYAADLARVGDGVLRPSIADVLSRTSRPGRELRASWPDALVVAAMLVVVDLLLRRLAGRKRRAVLVPNAAAPA